MRTHVGAWLCGGLLAVSGAAGAASDAPRGSATLEAPDTSELAGPGPIHASPAAPDTTDLPRGVAPALPSRTGPLARLLGNGTELNFNQGGANAIGYTGGLTTGAKGSAGAYAGGGGVHVGAVVIPPGQVNASMRGDDPRERLPLAAPDAGDATARTSSAR